MTNALPPHKERFESSFGPDHMYMFEGFYYKHAQNQVTKKKLPDSINPIQRNYYTKQATICGKFAWCLRRGMGEELPWNSSKRRSRIGSEERGRRRAPTGRRPSGGAGGRGLPRRPSASTFRRVICSSGAAAGGADGETGTGAPSRHSCGVVAWLGRGGETREFGRWAQCWPGPVS